MSIELCVTNISGHLFTIEELGFDFSETAAMTPGIAYRPIGVVTSLESAKAMVEAGGTGGLTGAKEDSRPLRRYTKVPVLDGIV